LEDNEVAKLAKAKVDLDRHKKISDNAACKGVDPSLFFADRGHADYDEVLALCRGCRVKEACLALGIAGAEALGIWGGLPPKARRRIPLVEKERLISEHSIWRCSSCGVGVVISSPLCASCYQSGKAAERATRNTSVARSA